VDEAMAASSEEERESRLNGVKDEVRRMRPVVCEKSNLNWEAGSIWRNLPRVMTGLARSFLR